MARREKHRKDAQLMVRINKAERDAFVALCEEEDTSAAREVRRFIRSFLDRYGRLPETNSTPRKG
ncbi:MAG: hypothetical protein CSA74_06640 [Rhodobacterales bacterium]|nr:MAG: hypothetical protein CSA74_06640 [Rhodobacterales bacterium]